MPANLKQELWFSKISRITGFSGFFYCPPADLCKPGYFRPLITEPHQGKNLKTDTFPNGIVISLFFIFLYFTVGFYSILSNPLKELLSSRGIICQGCTYRRIFLSDSRACPIIPI